MPDYAWWVPDYPGSPCLVEPGHYATPGRYVPEVVGEWMPDMCVTCGATDNPPWWMNPLTWGPKQLTRGSDGPHA
jgi:hypothetical protein